MDGEAWGCTATSVHCHWKVAQKGYAYVVCFPAEKQHGNKSYGLDCACLSPVRSRTHPGSSRAVRCEGPFMPTARAGLDPQG